MSLIGPRPDPLDDMDIYTEHQKKKLAVRPGITGYNQAYYRNSVEKHTVKLPLRVNWGGGWSDTPPYCNENGGTVLSGGTE